MSGYGFTWHGLRLEARPSGALWWPEGGWLIVADLHLGKSERMARRGERGHVCHLATRHQRERSVARQVEQVEQPAPHDLFGDRRGRRGGVQPRILVPRGGEPVRGDHRGQRAADHPREEAPAR